MTRASEYRNNAEEMRLLAQQMRFSENRDRLLARIIHEGLAVAL
jgi:hypothetical protein